MIEGWKSGTVEEDEKEGMIEWERGRKRELGKGLNREKSRRDGMLVAPGISPG
jgi:hypothetical protein